MKRVMKRFVVMLAVFVLTFGLMTLSASAAKVKTKKLKNADFTTDISKANKTASKVTKGTFKIKIGSKGSGYAKFKVPKTKAYTVTLSGVKTSGYSSFGHFYLMRKAGSKSYRYLSSATMKTKGGSLSTLYVATTNSTAGDVKYRHLKKRSGKLKLKKGEVVYLYFSFTGKNTSLTLNIK